MSACCSTCNAPALDATIKPRTSLLHLNAEPCPVRKILQMQGRQACLKPVVQHLFVFSGQL